MSGLQQTPRARLSKPRRAREVASRKRRAAEEIAGQGAADTESSLSALQRTAGTRESQRRGRRRPPRWRVPEAIVPCEQLRVSRGRHSSCALRLAVMAPAAVAPRARVVPLPSAQACRSIAFQRLPTERFASGEGGGALLVASVATIVLRRPASPTQRANLRVRCRCEPGRRTPPGRQPCPRIPLQRRCGIVSTLLPARDRPGAQNGH